MLKRYWNQKLIPPCIIITNTNKFKNGIYYICFSTEFSIPEMNENVWYEKKPEIQLEI